MAWNNWYEEMGKYIKHFINGTCPDLADADTILTDILSIFWRCNRKFSLLSLPRFAHQCFASFLPLLRKITASIPMDNKDPISPKPISFCVSNISPCNPI
jgi:hypothetical protein